MNKNQTGYSFDDDKSDMINKSQNDKLIEFPTNGNSDQFKIEGEYNPLIPNKNNHYQNALNNQEERGTIKVLIFLNVEFDFDGKIEMLKINNELAPTLHTIDSIISMAILEFNEILETRQSKYRINPTEQIWNLYMSKKNGKPKQDLPALDRDNLLSDTQEDMFTLDTKDQNKLWEEDSEKWLEYKEQQDDADYGMETNSKVDKQKEVKQSQAETQYSNIEKEIPKKNNVYNSSVTKNKKQQKKEVNSTCSGLCSFTKK